MSFPANSIAQVVNPGGFHSFALPSEFLCKSCIVPLGEEQKTVWGQQAGE